MEIFIFELSGFGEQRWLPLDFSSVISVFTLKNRVGTSVPIRTLWAGHGSGLCLEDVHQGWTAMFIHEGIVPHEASFLSEDPGTTHVSASLIPGGPWASSQLA